MSDTIKLNKRQTLKDRVLTGGISSIPDIDLLELILGYSILGRDVMPLAQRLMDKFGSLGDVLKVSPYELNKIHGIGPSTVALFKIISSVQTDHDPFTEYLPKGSMKTSKKSKMAGKEKLSPAGKPNNIPLLKKSNKQKFQVSNSYLLEFDRLAQILRTLLDNKGFSKNSRKDLQESTGLAERQVESLVSIGAAMGLIRPGSQVLTPAGLLIAEHDIFIEEQASLEWCHYAGACSFKNLVWFEVFNNLLGQSPMTAKEWSIKLRAELISKYSEITVKKNLSQEIHFIIDAYTRRNFSRLEVLNLSTEGLLYRRRYAGFVPLVLAAMVYDYCAGHDTHLVQMDDLAKRPGSPAVVFGVDRPTLSREIENLHDLGWLRYESTHDLDQIRLKSGYSALEFLAAHYEKREPERG
jgi:hypothetical protein